MVASKVSDRAVQHARFDRLLAQLSARFVNLTAEAVDGEILSALERIGSFLDADRVILLEFTENGSALMVKHSWAGPGVVPIQGGSLMGPRLPQVFGGASRRDRLYP